MISQRLAVTRDGNGRCAAMEILRGGPVTAKYIMENKIGELSDYIATRDGGMQRFDQHLLDLYHQKVDLRYRGDAVGHQPRGGGNGHARNPLQGWPASH